MARNRREVVVAFVGKDELTGEIQKLRNELGQVKNVGGAAAQGIEQINRQSAAAGTQMRNLATTTRFAATSLLSELNPALGGAVARMTSMASVARSAGTSISGGLVAAGIAVAVTALALWVKSTNEQIDRQVELNRRVKEFDVGAFSTDIRKLSTDLEATTLKLQTMFGQVLAFMDNVFGGLGQLRPGEGVITRLLIGDPGEIERQLAEARRLFDEIRKLQFPGEMAKLQSQTLAMRQQFFDRVSAFEDPARPGRTFGDIDYAERVTTLAAERQRTLARRSLDAEKMTLLSRAETEAEEIKIITAFNEKEQTLEAAHQLALLQIQQGGAQARIKLTEGWRAEGLRQTQADAGEELAAFEKINQKRTQLAQALLSVRDKFGDEGMLGAIQALGPAIDENVINKIRELEQDPVHAVNRLTKAWEEQQRQIERVADSVSNVFSDTLFDALEGRITDFGDVFRRTMINVAREASRDLFQGLTRSLLGGRSGGGGLLPFDLGGLGQVAGVAAAGIPVLGGAGGFGQTAQQMALAGPGFPGAFSDPFGFLSSALSGVGSFLNAPFLTFGGSTSFVGGGVAGGIQGGSMFGGLGVSPAGALAAGLSGAGIGATIFPQGGIGPMIGGALGGIGGAIGGAALGSALGIAAGTALGILIPGVGALIGAVAGSFLSDLIGGGKAKKQQQALQLGENAGGIANSLQSQAQSWAQDHPILGPVLLDAINTIGSYRTKTFAHAQRQLGLMEYLASLFAGRTPTPGEIYTWMQAADTPRFLGPDSLIFLLARPLEAILRDETLLGFRADIPGVAGTLFEAEFGRLGIPGVLPLIQAGITPSGVSLETAMVDGMQRLRATQRQIDAVENMSAAAVEALIFRLIRELERLGIPHGNLIEAVR